MNLLKYNYHFKGNILTVVSIGLLLVGLSACSTTPVVPTPVTPQVIPPFEPMPDIRHNVYHMVGPMETVWRISKMYDVRVEDIVRANNLNRKGDIDAGQKLLIPNAASLRPVINLYPSGKWKYIIIHHSATDVGNALEFHKYHSQKGWSGLGYHFVIDNGTMGKQDGQIEVSPRWIRQEDGAHCKAGDMNSRSIGICLVGNFSSGSISNKQMNSLIYLVRLLQNYYKIPKRKVVGHGNVSGATTECPGKQFPWKKFRTKL